MAHEVVRSLGAVGPQRRPGEKGRRATTGGPGRRAAHCSATRVENNPGRMDGKVTKSFSHGMGEMEILLSMGRQILLIPEKTQITQLACT